MLVFVKLFLVLTISYSVSAQITFSNVSKHIYDKINVYYVKGPTAEDRIKFKLVDGLSLTEQPNFDRNLTTAFLFHGWTGGTHSQSINAMAAAFTKKKLRNVVIFEYHELVPSNLVFIDIHIPTYTGYIFSLKNVPEIGKAIGQFLQHFIPSIQPKELIHLLSHSLGCEIMSHAAKSFGPGQLWFTALDPVGLNFYIQEQLQESDGSFVDIIHTDGYAVGDRRQLGSVDIYINGGKTQPGCKWDLIVACSHKRSWLYYVESISRETAFPAKKCTRIPTIQLLLFKLLSLPPYHCKMNSTDIIYMGPHIDKRAKGSYYLNTRSTPPYGLGTAGLNF